MMRYTARLSSSNAWLSRSSGSRVYSSQFVTGPFASSRLGAWVRSLTGDSDPQENRQWKARSTPRQPHACPLIPAADAPVLVGRGVLVRAVLGVAGPPLTPPPSPAAWCSASAGVAKDVETLQQGVEGDFKALGIGVVGIAKRREDVGRDPRRRAQRLDLVDGDFKARLGDCHHRVLCLSADAKARAS